MNHHTNKTKYLSGGFTLVEILVALSLFSVIVLICVGALLSLVGANYKAQNIQAVMNDLNVTIDGMVRNVREGSLYSCGSTQAQGSDCASGDTVLSFAPYGVDSSDQTKRWVYQFVPASGNAGGYIQRSKDGGITYSRITSNDVSFNDVTFFVIGTSQIDTVQPRVTIVFKGIAGRASEPRISSTFHIEASATQRELDL